MSTVRALAIDFGGTLANPGPSPDGSKVAGILGSLPGMTVSDGFAAVFDSITGQLRRTDRDLGTQTPFAERLCQAAIESGTVLPENVDTIVEKVFTAIPDGEIDAAAAQTLRLLHDRGMTCVLACDTQRPSTTRRATLQSAGILNCFHALVLSSEIGVRKPHSRFYDAVVAAAGCPVSEILFVGDTPAKDAIAPHARGMRSVLIATQRPAGLEESIGVIEHFSMLPEYLEALDAP
ncbi:hypothetical protein Pth03_12070 [Planotetraspora thailandica]|uniref:Haloacid dehalogenase n=1 Tax=Planotetraspora thailandica TaxID=487172 RepID=A0A8J3XXD4_9ACTN|nr:HAD family hydrolase [Planotetraspora thailandica]GII52818.1 hypothetical protein Pth03_12070 [Planotetraspora thailandica]